MSENVIPFRNDKLSVQLGIEIAAVLEPTFRTIEAQSSREAAFRQFADVFRDIAERFEYEAGILAGPTLLR